MFTKKSGTIAAFLILLFSLPYLTSVDAAPLPETPNAGLPAAAPSTIATSTLSGTVAVAPVPVPAPDRPVELIIPSIGLDDPIIPVGVNGKGEMAVPSGKTNDIGWYEEGTVPGEDGNAVLDAHVFAALKNLKYVPVGAEISVILQSGAVRHFIVRQSTEYPLASLSSDTLFAHAPGRWLNIITCEGHLTPDHSTYDHRRIVFAELVP